MSRCLNVLGFGLAVGLLSCGGSETPPPDTPQNQVAIPGSGRADAPDLSPVSAPKDLIAVARLSAPRLLLDKATRWGNVPLDWRTLLLRQEPGLEKVVAFEAPIEAAVVLAPEQGRRREPFAVVTLGLVSLGAALEFVRDKDMELVELGPGLYRVGMPWKVECFIGSSLGSAPARLVCGRDTQSVEALLPYATRGLPGESFGDAELVIQAYAGPLKQRYGAELRQAKMLVPLLLREVGLDNARFDRALADAAHGAVDEAQALIGDLEQLRIEAWLREDTNTLELGLSGLFSGSQSWTVETLKATQARAERVPEMFWTLPAESRDASWQVPAPTEKSEALAKTMLELFEGALDVAGVTEPVRKQSAAVLKKALALESVQVSAAGGSSEDGKTLRDRLANGLGWRVTGLQDDGAAVKDVLKQLEQILRQKGLKQSLAKVDHPQIQALAKELPTLVTKPAQKLGTGGMEAVFTLPVSWLEVLPALGGDGREDLEVGGPLAVTLLVAPGPSGSWISLSASRDEAYAMIERVRKGEGKTLASRKDLAQLKTANAIAGGYVTLETFTSSFGMQERTGIGKLKRALIRAPHHGKTPVFWTLRTEPGGTRTAASLRVVTPKGVIEDLAAAALTF